MNVEDRFKTVEDVELLIRWMQAPMNAKPVVPFDAHSYLNRLQLAVKWIYEHMSVRKVWPMMYEHFRAQNVDYSESTARRDVLDAQRLFCTDDSHNPRFWTALVLDALSESFKSAQRAHKYKEMKGLADALKGWMELGIKLGAIEADKPEPAKDLIAVVNPGEVEGYLGDNPNIILEVENFIRRRDHRKLLERGNIQDAQLSDDAGTIT